MRHTLRKYLSNRGSALFMVLSTMTALMVCCMAMYFSVVSSRSTQYAVFNQQQAYQSAVSISDAMIAEMVGGGSSDFGKLSKLFAEMTKVGDVRTTNANGFLAFGDTAGKEEESQIGAYMMTITRLDDETLGDGTKTKVFDIVITSSVNGTKEVVHNIIQLKETPAEKPLPGPTNVFTATGYVPNDVYLDGGDIITDVYFDNEQTIVNAYGGKVMNLSGNLSCGGSLTVNSYIQVTSTEPVTYAVRNNFKLWPPDEAQVITFPAPTATTGKALNEQRSTVMIGGDCTFGNEGMLINGNVYILGDLHLHDTTVSKKSKFFVKGNVYLHNDETYDLSQIYCNGKIIKDGTKTDPPAGTWEKYAQGKATDGLMTHDEMRAHLDERTQTGTYYKWIVDDGAVATGGTKTINFSTDINDQRPTYYLEYSESEKGCTIEDITMYHPNNGGYGNLTLVIDTGDNADNVYTINLKGNRDYLPGDIEKETFCWYPRNTYVNPWYNDGLDKSTWQGNGGNVPFQILVMGRGSVLFNVPDGVTYQDDDHLKVMHYGWFALNGGEEIYFGEDKPGQTKEYIVEHTVFKRPNDTGNDANFFAQFIHYGCEGGDGCTYTETNVTKECSSCGKKCVQVECDRHGVVDTYCKVCQPNRGKSANCSNRLDKNSIDKFIATKSDFHTKHSFMNGKDGKLIYPNVNIFIISCDENADIRLSSRAATEADKDPQTFIQNGFFGYVYAPYMTFKAGPSNSGGGMVRMLGGLTVSDYIIDDSYSLLACWPDKIPEDLMTEESFEHALPGIDNKSWKISLAGR